MYSQKFLDLKNNYVGQRYAEIDDDQFAALVYTFPSILVANADGNVDSKEKSFMRELPEVLTEGYMQNGAATVASTLTDEYFVEMNFLLKNLDKWRQPFLDVLKEQLQNSKNERNAIFEMMWRTADSSDDISEEERQVIEDISAQLGLS